MLRNTLLFCSIEPRMLYFMVILCSLGAAVQGMDESVISGGKEKARMHPLSDPNTDGRSMTFASQHLLSRSVQLASWRPTKLVRRPRQWCSLSVQVSQSFPVVLNDLTCTVSGLFGCWVICLILDLFEKS